MIGTSSKDRFAAAREAAFRRLVLRTGIPAGERLLRLVFDNAFAAGAEYGMESAIETLGRVEQEINERNQLTPHFSQQSEESHHGQSIQRQGE